MGKFKTLKFKTLFLMRGIPGSGKSTVACAIAGVKGSEIFRDGGFRYRRGTLGVVLSTDDYFMEGGEYRFNPGRIGGNHGRNQACCDHLMEDGEPMIVIDNTNTQAWEMETYVRMAKDHGYKVVVVEIPHPPLDVASARNSHGVPREAIERMMARWESKIPEGWNT